MKAKLRIGVIGLGYWGPNLVRNFYKVPNVEITAVSDLSEKNLEKLSGDYPSISLLSKNPSKLINSNLVDAVAIATPVSTHFRLAKEALDSGKHVLVEKPMTSKVSEAKELISLAEKKNLTLMVDHTFIYSEPVRKIKELIDKNQIGSLRYIDSTRINLGLFQSDVNVVWDLAPHDLSIINYLVGKSPLSIMANAVKHPQSKQEAMAYISIRYPNNLLAHVNVSWVSPVKLRTMLIGGSKKMIAYDHIHPSEKLKIYDHGVKISNKKGDPFNPIYRTGDILIPKIDSSEPLHEVCKHFIDSIFKNKKPLTSGDEGLEVVKLLEAANESLELSGSETKVG